MDLADDDALQPKYVLVKPPTQLSADVVQRHKHYGLAVLNGNSGIEIDHEANFGDIEEILRGFFPDLFDWFDGLPKVEANSGGNMLANLSIYHSGYCAPSFLDDLLGSLLLLGSLFLVVLISILMSR